MDRDELAAYNLAKPGAEETYPWGEEELVAKVGGKGYEVAVASLPKSRRPIATRERGGRPSGSSPGSPPR